MQEHYWSVCLWNTEVTLNHSSDSHGNVNKLHAVNSLATQHQNDQALKKFLSRGHLNHEQFSPLCKKREKKKRKSISHIVPLSYSHSLA